MPAPPSKRPTAPTPTPEPPALSPEVEVDPVAALRAAVAAEVRPVAHPPVAAAPPPAPAGEPWRPAGQQQAQVVGELLRHPFTLLAHPDQWELRRDGAGWVVVPRVTRLLHEAGVAGVDTRAEPDGRGGQVQHADPGPAILARQQRGYVPLPLDAGLAPGSSYVLVHRTVDGRIAGYSDPWSRAGIGGRTLRDEAAYLAWVRSLVGRWVPPPRSEHLDLLRGELSRRRSLYGVDGKHPEHVAITGGQLLHVGRLLEEAGVYPSGTHQALVAARGA